MRITEAKAKNSEPGTKLWDDEVTGFSLWISPKGKRTWYVQKSVHNQTKRQKIGSWPEVSVQDARRRAREIVATWQGEFDGARSAELASFTTEELALELLRRVQVQS